MKGWSHYLHKVDCRLINNYVHTYAFSWQGKVHVSKGQINYKQQSPFRSIENLEWALENHRNFEHTYVQCTDVIAFWWFHNSREIYVVQCILFLVDILL